jgi:PAS domain S-box-containing protein
MDSRPSPNPTPWKLILIFLALVIGLSATAYIYYLHQREDIKNNAIDRLEAIADLKMREIFNWREERLADARFFHENLQFIRSMDRFFKNQLDPESRRDALEWLTHLKENHDYSNILLLDSHASVRLRVVGEGDRVDNQAQFLAAQAMSGNEIILSDLKADDPPLNIHIDIFIPVVPSGSDPRQPLGVLLVRIDPQHSLFPFIEHWPTPSPTSETFLVRREGEDVLYLNELRHRKNTALVFRMPLSQRNLPASAAVQGKEGIVEGIDYRGTPVLAYLKQIPDSPWALVAKVDIDEVYAPVRERAKFVLVVVLTLILGAGMGVGFLWRMQQAEFYRRQFEAGLERQALTKHFEYLTKYANDILILADIDGNIVEVNDRGLAAFGYTRDEILGMNLRALQLPEDWAEVDAILKKLDQRDGLVFETVKKRKDGRTFPVETSARSFRINEKQFFQAIIRDISERRRAEQALNLLSSVVDQTADAVMITNKDGLIEYVNPSFEDLVGYTREEALGQTPRILNSGRHDRKFYEDLWKTILSGKAYRGVMTNKKKNGELYYEEETITPIRDAPGNITHFVSTARDITQRIRIQDNLARRQDTLQAVYEMAITPGSSFQAICDQAVSNLSRLLGLSHVMVHQVTSGEVRVVSTITVGELSHEVIDCPIASLSAPVLERGVTFQFKSSLRERFPKNAYFEKYDLETFVAVPIKDDAGAPIGFIIGMDFEARSLSEDEIQLMEIFASYIGQEIERGHLQAQLQKAHEMKILGQMASGVAHEVRNPLNAILSITEAVNQELEGNPDFETHLRHIREQVNRLSQLMQDLLELGKPIPASSLQPASIPEICTAGVDLWKQYHPSDSHRISLTIDAEDHDQMRVIANSPKLSQVFINLLDNASQHSPVESEIQVAITRLSGSNLRVAITDQGAGIDPKNLSRLSEPFFTTRKGGTGLGLSIVKHIVELHGGNLSIRNNIPAPGCTVEIVLPSA